MKPDIRAAAADGSRSRDGAMAPIIETATNVVFGVYRLATEGPGIWIVRTVLFSLVAMEPRDYIVVAATLAVLGAVCFAVLRFLFENIVVFITRVLNTALARLAPTKHRPHYASPLFATRNPVVLNAWSKCLSSWMYMSPCPSV